MTEYLAYLTSDLVVVMVGLIILLEFFALWIGSLRLAWVALLGWLVYVFAWVVYTVALTFLAFLSMTI